MAVKTDVLKTQDERGEGGYWLYHRPLSINGGCRISRDRPTFVQARRLLVDLRYDRLHFRLVPQLQLLLPCGGRGSIPDATVALTREPPSTSELLATAIPRLDDVLAIAHGGVDVRDRYLVAGFDFARRDETHLRVAAFKRWSRGRVAGVRDVG